MSYPSAFKTPEGEIEWGGRGFKSRRPDLARTAGQERSDAEGERRYRASVPRAMFGRPEAALLGLSPFTFLLDDVGLTQRSQHAAMAFSFEKLLVCEKRRTRRVGGSVLLDFESRELQHYAMLRCNKVVDGHPDIASYLAEENRGNVSPGVERERRAAAVLMSVLPMRTPLSNLHEAQARENRRDLARPEHRQPPHPLRRP